MIRSVFMSMVSVVLAAIAIVTANFSTATADTSTQSYGTPVDLGAPIQQIALFDSAYGVENGHHMLYTTTNGQPAQFNVINLDSYTLTESFPLDGSTSVWAHLVAPDGSVYIGANGSGKFYRYSPTDHKLLDLGRPIPTETTIWGLVADEAGNVYGGTFPDGKVFKYDPQTGKVTDYGNMVSGQQYVRSIAYANGYIYAGIGSRGAIVKLNVKTGEKTEIAPPQGVTFSSFIYSLDVRSHYLFVESSASPTTLFIYDLDSQQWLTQSFPNYKGLFVSPVSNDKVYFVQNGILMAFDIQTQQTTPTSVKFGTYLRHSGVIQVQNDPNFPGDSLVTVGYDGHVYLLNPETGNVKSLPPIVQGQPIDIQSLEKGPDGKLYISGYLAATGAQYDPSSGTMVHFPLGQSEGMGSLYNKMYFGVYPGAHIFSANTSAPTPTPSEVYTVSEEQDRPFAFATGDSKLFIGTVPEYGQLGGTLSVYDSSNGNWSTYRNIVQDQSVIGLAYRDGKVYGSTSVWGGLGSQPTAPSAKVFVWDMASQKKVAETAPQFADVTPKAIGQLSFGPDGQLLGASQGTIFAMNPDTLQVERWKSIYPSDWNIGHYWRPVYLRWGPTGMLYTTLGGKLTVVDPQSLSSQTLDETSLMTIGDDGNLYYAKGTDLFEIPVTYPHLQRVNLTTTSDALGDYAVTVSANGANGLYGGKSVLDFNSQDFNMKDVKLGADLSNDKVEYNHGEDGKLEINIIPNQPVNSTLNGNGDVITVDFSKKDNASSSTVTSVTLSGETRFMETGEPGSVQVLWPITGWIEF